MKISTHQAPSPRLSAVWQPHFLRRAAVSAVALVAVALFVAAPASSQVTRPDDIVYPPLPESPVPQPQRVEMDNGMVVILLEDHELPLIEARAVIRTGARWEPADKVGLAELFGQVQRSGGTEKLPSDQLDDLLEDRAASIETGIGNTNGSASLSSLRDDFPEMLRVFADVLRHPAFEQDQLDVAKTQAAAGIARQNDSADQIVGREFTKLIYGSESPYARFATYETVDNISRDDLLAWHRNFYHPDRIILGLVGDFESEEVLELIEAVFGDWQKGPTWQEPEVAYRREANPGVFFVEKNDITQAFIRIGHLGITRDNPDYYAVDLMNQVLSGSFAARLFTRIRTQKGLAYGVRGGVGSRWDYPGLTALGMSTKTETTAAGIDALLEEVDNMTSEPPTDEEVRKAKAGILKSFVFRADSASKILGQQLTYEYFGFPLDWQDRYRKGIEAVTTAEVRAAAAKYFHPERFSILVVGNREGMDRPLSTFGDVRTVDITIPEPAVATVAATPETEAQGRALIAKAVEGIGGATRLDALETFRTQAKMRAISQGGAQLGMRAAIILPDRMRWELQLPFGTMVQVLNGDASFAQSPAGAQPLPAAQRKELAKSLQRLAPVLLRHRDDPGFKAIASGVAEVDGTRVETVQVELEGNVNTLGIDPESGKILSITYQGSNLGGAPGQLEQRFSDFREVDGLILPFASVTTFNGETMLEGTVESSQLDSPIDDAEFEMPSP
ncbi:MAG: pitrilysin family protein [Acidobacteriota bacterium]